MHIEYRKWLSTSLRKDMALKVYGHHGQPIVVFPTENGRFFDFEDFGMIDACKHFIDEGLVRFIAVDSIDDQSWSNQDLLPGERLKHHLDYERYIMNEVVPFIRRGSQDPEERLFTTGASMGGYHAANFFFRRPDVFGGLIALSAMFQVRHFIGDYMDDSVYFHSPLHYLGHLTDETYLEPYRKSKIVICVGKGPGEAPILADVYALKNILDEKEIPAWVDIWGYDVDHDWEWWRKQLPYFLGRLFEGQG